MEIIHIHKTIDSETLHLPELKTLIGQTVEIIVLQTRNAGSAPGAWLPGFWEQISRGWQGEPIVRPDQGVCETRDQLR